MLKRFRHPLRLFWDVVVSCRFRAARMRYRFLLDREAPLDRNLILLESLSGRMPHGNMFYVLRELRENERYRSYDIYYVTYDRAARRAAKRLFAAYGLGDVRTARRGGWTYSRILATATYLFTDVCFAPWFVKREGQVFWSDWHGSGSLNKADGRWGATSCMIPSQRCFALANYITNPSAHVQRYLLDAYMAGNLARDAKMMLTGSPRNSTFFDLNRAAETRKKLGGRKRMYAYLPTWRVTERGEPRDALASYQRMFHDNLRELDGLLNEDELFLVKMHPNDPTRPAFHTFRHIAPLPDTLETYDALAACDALVSDYSSVISDFVCSRKKIVLFQFDLDLYTRIRGFAGDRKDAPFPIVFDVPSLVQELRSPKTYDETAYLASNCAHESADAPKRLLAHILDGEPSYPESPPPGNGRPNVLVCPGAHVLGQGPEALVRLALKPCWSDGRNAYLALESAWVWQRLELVAALPDSVSYMISVRGGALSYGEDWLERLVSCNIMPFSIFRKLSNRYYELEAWRSFGGGAWFAAAVCEADAPLCHIMTVAATPCEKILYATPESLASCRRDVFAYACTIYDRIVVDAPATEEMLRGLAPALRIPVTLNTDV